MNVEDMWTFIKNNVQQAMTLYIPKTCKSKKSLNEKCFTSNIFKSVKKKHHLYKKYLNTRNGIDYMRYVRMRNQVCNKIKRTKKTYEGRIAKDCTKNPKLFWQYVNNKTKFKERISPLIVNNDLITSDKGKAEAFNNYFSSVFTNEDKNNIPDIDVAL